MPTLCAAVKSRFIVKSPSGSDVVLGTCTRVVLKYSFEVLVLVFILEGWVLVLVLVLEGLVLADMWRST